MHADICFQHFQSVNLHSCIVKSHFLIGFLRVNFCPLHTALLSGCMHQYPF
ncbi:hypothetical protein EVA_06324 [gut metagenome]|uniref:Uncharacterized protein n=1 Tax=gut metagenome TaxID=749906 RepID=J9GE20_9ZZZZ